jgi:hypothetical protein
VTWKPSKRADGARRARSADLDTVQDFEDMLDLLERFEVRYLIIGGLAFIYHQRRSQE